MAQLIRSLPAMQETWVWFLGCVGKIPWRRKWQPTPVFLLPTLVFCPWEQRSLVGYSPWGLEESDMTEWLHFFYVLCKFKVYNMIICNIYIWQKFKNIINRDNLFDEFYLIKNLLKKGTLNRRKQPEMFTHFNMKKIELRISSI